MPHKLPYNGHFPVCKDLRLACLRDPPYGLQIKLPWPEQYPLSADKKLRRESHAHPWGDAAHGSPAKEQIKGFADVLGPAVLPAGPVVVLRAIEDLRFSKPITNCLYDLCSYGVEVGHMLLDSRDKSMHAWRLLESLDLPRHVKPAGLIGLQQSNIDLVFLEDRGRCKLHKVDQTACLKI